MTMMLANRQNIVRHCATALKLDTIANVGIERAMGKRQLLNVVPNFAGVGAGLLFPLLFNIVYYRLLGTEGYGLIGFYALLAIIASLMDLGLSQTTLREVARRASDHEHAGELPSLVLTLALISCALGSLVGLSAVASSKWLATSWLDLSRLSVDEVATAIATMGGIVALLFPANILNATLRGLQRQVLFNTIAIVAGACRGVVTIAALHVFGSTPLIFFSAQLLISACEVMVLAVIVGVLLPRSRSRLRFDFRLFQATWQFTFTVWLSIVIGQLILLSDKVVMSAVLPLDLFGLYSIAFTVASTVQRLATPFSNAYLPHFVELFEKRTFELLSQAYHLASRLASAVVICAGLLLVVYAQPIMLLLTADAASADTIAPVFALLVAANTLAALMVMPQMLQIACGTRLDRVAGQFLAGPSVCRPAGAVGAAHRNVRAGRPVARGRVGEPADHDDHDASGCLARAGMALVHARDPAACAGRGGRARRWRHRGARAVAGCHAAVVGGELRACAAAALLCAFGGKFPDLGPPRPEASRTGQQQRRPDRPESQEKNDQPAERRPEHGGVEDQVVGNHVPVGRIGRIYFRGAARALGGELVLHPGQRRPIGVRLGGDIAKLARHPCARAVVEVRPRGLVRAQLRKQILPPVLLAAQRDRVLIELELLLGPFDDESPVLLRFAIPSRQFDDSVDE